MTIEERDRLGRIAFEAWDTAPDGRRHGYLPWDQVNDKGRERWRRIAEAVALAIASAATVPPGDFQDRVKEWLVACFGDGIASDVVERCHRFLEESLELVQSLGIPAGDCRRLVEYTYDRPAGNPAQEVGGVMTTLAALCSATGLDMGASAEAELSRVWAKVDDIRAKQAAKPKGSPLPEHTAESRP